jgi:hypothetical protein
MVLFADVREKTQPAGKTQPQTKIRIEVNPSLTCFQNDLFIIPIPFI